MNLCEFYKSESSSVQRRPIDKTKTYCPQVSFIYWCDHPDGPLSREDHDEKIVTHEFSLKCGGDVENKYTPACPLKDSWNPIIDKIDYEIRKGKKLVGIAPEPLKRTDDSSMRKVIIKFENTEDSVVINGSKDFFKKKIEHAKLYIDAKNLTKDST
ncbi:MAG: hypothetical protein ABIK28_21800 [Planctomycetota bacterium]